MSVDWTNIPIGVGVAVLLIREVSRFMRERQGDKAPNGGAGSRSVEFWEGKQREIVYTEIERHILPLLRDARDKLVVVDQNVRELRWRHGRSDRKDDDR